MYNRDNFAPETMITEARERLEQIRARIQSACERAGREPREVLLIGASKTVPAAKLDAFLRCGLEHCGENYIQEGAAKIEVLRPQYAAATFHFIGALQSNKAREAVQYFDTIHSVDRLSLIAALDKAARAAGKIQNVLIQVKLGGELSKGGCAPQEASTLAAQIVACANLQLCGLMCLPPYHENPEAMRPYFRALRNLREEIQQETILQSVKRDDFLHLSMGMSNDFEVAIEEGATMVRIGTALFGAREN